MTLSVDPKQGAHEAEATEPLLPQAPLTTVAEPADRYADAQAAVQTATAAALPPVARATPLPPIPPLQMRDNSSFHAINLTRAHAPEIVEAYRQGARLGLLFPSKRRITFFRPIGFDEAQNPIYDENQIATLRGIHQNEIPLLLHLTWQTDSIRPLSGHLWVTLRENGTGEEQADIELPFLNDRGEREALGKSGWSLIDLLLLVSRATFFEQKKKILTRLAHLIVNGALRHFTPEALLKIIASVSPEQTICFLKDLRRLTQSGALPCFIRRLQPESAASWASQLWLDLEGLGVEESTLVLNRDLTGKQIAKILEGIPAGSAALPPQVPRSLTSAEERPAAVSALDDLFSMGFFKKTDSVEQGIRLLSRPPPATRVRVWRLLSTLAAGDCLHDFFTECFHLKGQSWHKNLSEMLLLRGESFQRLAGKWKKEAVCDRKENSMFFFQVRRMAVLMGDEPALPFFIDTALRGMRCGPSFKPALHKFLLALLQNRDNTAALKEAFRHGRKEQLTVPLYVTARGFLSGCSDTSRGRALLASLDRAYLEETGSAETTVSPAHRASLIAGQETPRPDSLLFIREILAEADPNLARLITALRQSNLRLEDAEAFFFSTEPLAFVRDVAGSRKPDAQALLNRGMRLLQPSIPPEPEPKEQAPAAASPSAPALAERPATTKQAEEAPTRLSPEASRFLRRNLRIHGQEDVALAFKIFSYVDPDGAGKMSAALRAKGTGIRTGRSVHEAQAFVRTGNDGFAKTISLKENASLQDFLMILAEGVPLDFFAVHGISVPPVQPMMSTKDLVHALIEVQIIRKALALHLALAWAGKVKNLGEPFSFPATLVRTYQESGITGLMEWVRLNPAELSRIRRKALEETFVLKWLGHRGETPPASQAFRAGTVFDREATRNETLLQTSPMTETLLSHVRTRLATLTPLSTFLARLEEYPLSGTEEDPGFEEGVLLWGQKLDGLKMPHLTDTAREAPAPSSTDNAVSFHLARLKRSGIVQKDETYVNRLPEWVRPEEAVLFLAALKVLGELDRGLLEEYLRAMGGLRENRLAPLLKNIRTRIDLVTKRISASGAPGAASSASGRISASIPSSHPLAKALKAALMEGLDLELGFAIAGDTGEEAEARFSRIRTAWDKVQNPAPRLSDAAPLARLEAGGNATLAEPDEPTGEPQPGGDSIKRGPNGNGPLYRTHPWGVFSPRTVATPRMASLVRL